MNLPDIAVFGANPAWQKTVVFESLRTGKVNRAVSMTAYPSGKGINFCRAARCGGLCTTRLYQFAGGIEGKRLQDGLEKDGFMHVTVACPWETRVCTTLIDHGSGETTELIEPSSPVGSEAADDMIRAWTDGIASASGAAVTGSLPDGTDPLLYCRAAKAVFREKIPFLIDAVTGIRPALDPSASFILKINADELKKLTGVENSSAALRKAAEIWPLAVFAITDGPGDAMLAAEGAFYRYSLPEIRVVNPIGSGDTCSAMLLSSLLAGKPVRDAFAEGLAAASANCLTPMAGEFRKEDCARLLPSVSAFLPDQA